MKNSQMTEVYGRMKRIQTAQNPKENKTLEIPTLRECKLKNM